MNDGDHRLDSWKEIAAFLRRDVRTVQRWEGKAGLPVHRVPGAGRRVVYAYTAELEAWLQSGARPDDDAEDRRWTTSENARASAVTVSVPKGATRSVFVAKWATGIGVTVAAVLVSLLRLPLPVPKVRGYHQLSKGGPTKILAGTLLADSARIYFSGSGHNDTNLLTLPLTGGDTPVALTQLRYGTLFDFSAVRRELLIGGSSAAETEHALWVVPAEGGAPRRVGNVSADSACWSPDGRRIAYAKGHDLFLVDPGGYRSRKLVTVPEYPIWLRWSPDGKVLRFTCEDASGLAPEPATLWEVFADGTHLRPLLPGFSKPPWGECCGKWTAGGKYFVFQSSRNGENDLWVLPEKVSFFRRGAATPVQLTRGPLGFEFPVPSQDGKELFALGSEEHGESMRYDLRLHEWVPFLGGIAAEWVTTSRDERWIAYLKYPEGTLWRSRPDGSEPRQLTFSPLRSQGGLSWSPDSKRIALRAGMPGKPSKIYLVPADGGKPQELMPEHQGEEGIATWSPDGKHLVFGDVPPIFRHATGSEIIHLYDFRTNKSSKLPASEGLWTSRWSPDGRYIGALTIGTLELMLFDTQKSKWRRFGINEIDDVIWSHDGKYIYFDRLDLNPSPVFRVRIDTGRTELVAPSAAPKRWLGLGPEDSPLVLGYRGTNEIYEIDWEHP